MKFVAVTPVRNGEHWIGETVRSIVSQSVFRSGEHELEYVVMDALSTDGTVAAAQEAGGGAVRIRTEADAGMYDALARAWRSTSGDVYFYLNAGDVLAEHALEQVAHFLAMPEYDWVSGLVAYVSAPGPLIGTVLPPRYDTRLIRTGRYGRTLPFVQQESQFWSARAMSLVDLDRLSGLRLAGDYYLWHTFARRFSPLVVQAVLGGWRLHGDHQSADMDRYWREVDSFAEQPHLLDRLSAGVEWVRWRLPERMKTYRTRHIATYDKQHGVWAAPSRP